MTFRLGDIAAALGVEALGDGDIVLRGAAEPALAGPDDLAIALSPAWAAGLAQGRARAAILWPGADWQALGLSGAIAAPRGRLAVARVTALLDDGPAIAPGIHATAVIDPLAEIGAGAAIGPLTVIGAGARVGANARIEGQVSIAPGVVIGADALICAGVRIARRVRIGDRVVLQPNVVIGGDGFSFVTATPAHVETARETLGRGPVTVPDDPTWHRIHSLGGVVIGDDVEVGAGSTIDAGTIRATQVGRGTKIDNLVQVGHNVIVGQDCLLCAQAGVAGSSRVGDRVVLGGKAGVADNLVIGDDVVVGGGSVVLSNVPAGRVMMGSPATRMDTHIESYKALRRLPRLLRDGLSRQNKVSNPSEND
ncbi:MAG: UDP-3-O-(3-hydroxymyristoyl)glucosamine N-acyltransferase [Rhodobacterales bacterium]|nr:UDP-3-O-(3-hydroxymyristoyl)glucosamine N-acyltransferase [Rhodobacterales bacterium]